MKVYFSAARSKRDEFGKTYEGIIMELVKRGYQVIDNGRIKLPSGTYLGLSKQRKSALYKDMVKRIEKADISVFEASYPSTLHIGHEITVALSKGKPVVVLYVKDREPIMFHGMSSSSVIWVEYDGKNLSERLGESLEKAEKKIDVRFNFFLPKSLLVRLDSLTRGRGINKSELIRHLIEKDMKKNMRYLNVF